MKKERKIKNENGAKNNKKRPSSSRIPPAIGACKQCFCLTLMIIKRKLGNIINIEVKI
jgi:hypothetical protein